MVRGPGQYFLVSNSKRNLCFQFISTSFSACFSSRTCTMMGSVRGLFLVQQIFISAAAFNALAPNPYTVQVGKATNQPCFNLQAAYSISFSVSILAFTELTSYACAYLDNEVCSFVMKAINFYCCFFSISFINVQNETTLYMRCLIRSFTIVTLHSWIQQDRLGLSIIEKIFAQESRLVYSQWIDFEYIYILRQSDQILRLLLNLRKQDIDSIQSILLSTFRKTIIQDSHQSLMQLSHSYIIKLIIFFGLMDLEEEQLQESMQSNLNQVPHIFNNLLEEEHSEQSEQESVPNEAEKEIPQMAAQDIQPSHNLHFNLRSIEVRRYFTKKEDFNCFLPEKAYPLELEQDPLEEIILPPKGLHETTLSPRKTCQINRIAYLQETRADKIARYLEKKQRRIWYRKISYDCRKVVADKRQRKNGRFIKKEQSNIAVSSAKRSWETKEAEAKQECSVFKVQDYYQ